MNSFNIQENDSRQKSVREAALEQAKYLTPENNNPVQKQDILLYAFFQILESVGIQSNVALTQTKMLESNAQTQQRLNDRQSELNFESVNPNLKFTGKAKDDNNINLDIQKVQMKNQQTQKELNYLGNALLRAQQNAQVTQTQVSSTTNNIQQATQIDSSITQMLSQITNQISKT